MDSRLLNRGHPRPCSLSLFAHPPVDAGNEGVSVGFVGAAFVVILDDDGFATGEPPVQHQNYFPLLKKFAHLEVFLSI